MFFLRIPLQRWLRVSMVSIATMFTRWAVVALLVQACKWRCSWAVTEAAQTLRCSPSHGSGDQSRNTGSHAVVGYDELLENPAVSGKAGGEKSTPFLPQAVRSSKPSHTHANGRRVGTGCTHQGMT